jgi:hypothetical protein
MSLIGFIFHKLNSINYQLSDFVVSFSPVLIVSRNVQRTEIMKPKSKKNTKTKTLNADILLPNKVIQTFHGLLFAT